MNNNVLIKRKGGGVYKSETSSSHYLITEEKLEIECRRVLSVEKCVYLAIELFCGMLDKLTCLNNCIHTSSLFVLPFASQSTQYLLSSSRSITVSRV